MMTELTRIGSLMYLYIPPNISLGAETEEKHYIIIDKYTDTI